jgi:hypothetical protein
VLADLKALMELFNHEIMGPWVINNILAKAALDKGIKIDGEEVLGCYKGIMG